MVFITIEGGEGSGKTTLIQELERALVLQGCAVVRTREPGGTKLSEQIRQWLLEDREEITVGSKAEFLMFLAARAQHLEELIIPALKQGKVVLCDRFNDSTIAYQGAARGLGTHFVEQICDLVCEQYQPDLTFYLDIDPLIGLERSTHVHKDEALAGEKDRIESAGIAFHQQVRHAFLELANKYPERIRVIDATQPKEVVFKQALACVNERVALKNLKF